MTNTSCNQLTIVQEIEIYAHRGMKLQWGVVDTQAAGIIQQLV